MKEMLGFLGDVEFKHNTAIGIWNRDNQPIF